MMDIFFIIIMPIFIFIISYLAKSKQDLKRDLEISLEQKDKEVLKNDELRLLVRKVENKLLDLQIYANLADVKLPEHHRVTFFREYQINKTEDGRALIGDVLAEEKRLKRLMDKKNKELQDESSES